jgi:hypothetical protein
MGITRQFAKVNDQENQELGSVIMMIKSGPHISPTRRRMTKC